MKRVVAIAVLLICAAAFQCAAQANPVSAKPITVSMMVKKEAAHGTFADMRIFKALEALTNVHIDFIEVPAQGFDERKNLSLATGDLPDIFWGSTITTSDEDTYGPQKAFIRLNALIDSDGPHIKAAMAKYPLMRKSMVAADGNIYSLGAATITPTMGPYKMRINKTWLAKLGLKMPATVDDFYNVLKAFKERDPNGNGKRDEIPLSHYEGMDTIDANLLPPYGFVYGYTDDQRVVNVINNKVVFFRSTPAYKDYLQYMSRLYKEQLLDNQVFSQTEDEYSAKTGQNVLGVLTDIDDADYHDFEMIEPMTSRWNTTKLATPIQHFTASSFTITRTNKYPHESIRWADIFYRDVNDPWNGFSGVSVWLGQQGVDWDYTSTAKTQVSYLFTPLPNTNQTVSYSKIIGPGWGLGTVVIDAPFKSDILAWAADQSRRHLFPYQIESMLYPSAIRFVKADADRVAILSTDLKKYTEEMEAKFIAGEESLATWDSYLSALKKIGVDQYVSLLQAAYDKFNR
jgi:putative aldouronate transport system substrate-binding protein